MPREVTNIVLVGLINITPQVKNIKDDKVYTYSHYYLSIVTPRKWYCFMTRNFAAKNIDIRNGKIVWKPGPNRPFFLITWVPKIIRTKPTQVGIKYKHRQCGKLKHFKVEVLTTSFMLNLSMPDENCTICNCNSFRTAPWISFSRIPMKNDYKIKLEEKHCYSYYSGV